MSRSELESVLQDIRANLSFPPTPQIARGVRARLGAEERPEGRPFWAEGWQLAAAAVATLLVVAGAALAVSPSARAEILDRLQIGDIDIFFLDDDEGQLPETPDDLARQLGELVSLDEAEATTGRAFPLPRDDRLGPPDAVYLNEQVGGRAVTLVYREAPGFPADPVTGIALLITQFIGSPDVAKQVAAPARAEPITVNGAPGYWVEGPHTLIYPFSREPTVRRVDNVLIWEHDGVTYRLESQTSKEEALAIAESLSVD
jgi:Domain of unknown function (DUF4367)